MIKKQLLSAVLILALAACLFSGCLGDDKIVGTWKGEEKGMVIHFNNDGTYIIDSEIEGTWKKKGREYILYTSQNSKAGTGTFDGEKFVIQASSSSSPFDTFVRV